MALLCSKNEETLNHNHTFDWSDLPYDLILIIGDHLDTYTDYVRFRAVCVSYRNSLPEWPMHQHYNVPRLMLPYDVENTLVRGFFNPLNQEVLYPDLGELTSTHCYCRGASNGWLVTLDANLTLKLFNPLTKSQIQLPPISSFPDFQSYDPNRCGGEFRFIDPTTADQYPLSKHLVHSIFIRKIVLSSSNNDFVAVAIYKTFSRLAFTKLGHHKWTPVPTSLHSFHDCILFKEKFYAVNNFRNLVVFPVDIGMPQVEDVEVVIMKDMHMRRLFVTSSFNKSKLYLVSRDDELLMVERLFQFKPIQIEARTRYIRKTVGFNLFKLEWSKKGIIWSVINSLNDYTIFLGLNTSLCISSKHCPKLRGNQIYYTSDQRDHTMEYNYFGGHDFGVFDVSNGSCNNLLHDYDYPLHQISGWPNPIWVVLNPY